MKHTEFALFNNFMYSGTSSLIQIQVLGNNVILKFLIQKKKKKLLFFLKNEILIKNQNNKLFFSFLKYSENLKRSHGISNFNSLTICSQPKFNNS